MGAGKQDIFFTPEHYIWNINEESNESAVALKKLYTTLHFILRLVQVQRKQGHQMVMVASIDWLIDLKSSIAFESISGSVKQLPGNFSQWVLGNVESFKSYWDIPAFLCNNLHLSLSL